MRVCELSVLIVVAPLIKTTYVTGYILTKNTAARRVSGLSQLVNTLGTVAA